MHGGSNTNSKEEGKHSKISDDSMMKASFLGALTPLLVLKSPMALEMHL